TRSKRDWSSDVCSSDLGRRPRHRRAERRHPLAGRARSQGHGRRVRGLDGMSDLGKVRIRIPSRIVPGDVVQVRTLVIHPMERIERDAQGKIIPKTYNYIHRVVVTYLGKTIVTFDTTQSVSENPFFSFALRAADPGPLKVEFLDTTGGRYEGTVQIKFS